MVPQNIQGFLDTLPTNINDLQILTIRLSPVPAVLCCQDKGSSQLLVSVTPKITSSGQDKRSTFFLTASSDNYCAEMHNLMMHSTTSLTISVREQAVTDHPHIADWLFTGKLSDFIEQWLHEPLRAEWHWYHFEYQARGSTHAHGCAKLKNDPGISWATGKPGNGNRNRNGKTTKNRTLS